MEMELRTNEQELQQFQFRFVREIWPTEGMRCKVDGCTDDKFYVKLGRYLDHWSQTHSKMIKLFKCSACRKVFSTKAKGNSHLKTHRGRSEATLTTKLEENRNFIDPGDVLPPRPCSAEERQQLRDEARATARQQRETSITPLYLTEKICREKLTNYFLMYR